MKKLVINATQGGAHIKGTLRMPLDEVIAKYCTEPIDKAVVTKYLTLADNGDALIAKVVPLLKIDIKNLDAIISQSRKGLATCHGMQILINKPGYSKLSKQVDDNFFNRMQEQAAKQSGGSFTKMNELYFEKLGDRLPKGLLRNIVILSGKNFKFSEEAHEAAKLNPLVSVAIYGASRRIYHRDMKAKETLPDMLKNRKGALTRIKRNEFILKAAKDAAETLVKSYKETYALLKKYNKTKDESLLVSTEKEPVDLSSAEAYFKVGNFAHPLLDAEKLIDEISKNATNIDDIYNHPKYEKAVEIYNKALDMRTKAIDEAKANEAKNGNRESRLLRYNSLLEQSKEEGRKAKDFDKALALLKKAAKLMPEETEARWGVATALHHSGKIKESLKEYRRLVKDFPDDLRFRFEMGQVMLRDNDLQGGLKEIVSVMEKTEEFDYFLARLGEIYQHIEKIEEAALAYETYLKKYPSNYEVWAKHGDCLSKLKRKAEARKAYKMALSIKPDYKQARQALDLL